MIKVWTYISEAGITEDIAPSEAKRYILLNQFLAIAILFSTFYAFLFGYYGYQKGVTAETFFILSYYILWLVSNEKYAKLARFLFMIIINFQLYIACLIFGEAAQIHLIYGPVATVPIVLYEFKQKKIIFLFAIVTLILMFDLFRINFSSVLSTTLSVNAAHYFRLMSNAVAIVCEVIVVYSLVISANEVEQKLGKTNILLEDQFKTIFNNSSDALFLVDDESNLVLSANKRAIELFEMKRESDFYPYKLLNFLKNEVPENEYLNFRNQLVLNGFFEQELLFMSNKGKEFWGAFAIRVFKEGDKKFRTVRITDITENKKNQTLIKASLNEKKVLLAEIHHRVKNNLAVISGLLSLQASHIDDEKLKSLFEESRNRIHSMALIHEKLYQHETFASIQMGSYVNDLVNNIKISYKTIATNVIFSISSNENVLDIKYAVPCGLILNELISNAY